MSVLPQCTRGEDEGETYEGKHEEHAGRFARYHVQPATWNRFPLRRGPSGIRHPPFPPFSRRCRNGGVLVQLARLNPPGDVSGEKPASLSGGASANQGMHSRRCHDRRRAAGSVHHARGHRGLRKDHADQAAGRCPAVPGYPPFDNARARWVSCGGDHPEASSLGRFHPLRTRGAPSLRSGAGGARGSGDPASSGARGMGALRPLRRCDPSLPSFWPAPAAR
jgi:hypothetical protein